MNKDIKLSEHFSLGELTKTSHRTKDGNIPSRVAIENLRNTLMEQSATMMNCSSSATALAVTGSTLPFARKIIEGKWDSLLVDMSEQFVEKLELLQCQLSLRILYPVERHLPIHRSHQRERARRTDQPVAQRQ